MVPIRYFLEKPVFTHSDEIERDGLYVNAFAFPYFAILVCPVLQQGSVPISR